MREHSIDWNAINADSEAEVLAAGWGSIHALSSYDELTQLIEPLKAAANRLGNTADLILMRAVLLQKRAEWCAASDLLMTAIARFPDRLDLIYEAALLSIDASLYDRARDLLSTLARRIGELSERHLRGVWRAASLLSMHDVALAAFSTARAAGAEAAVPRIGARIERALANQDIVRAAGIPVISIGENCFPWMVMNRWGLRTDAGDPTQNMVFNLAQTSTDGAASILERRGLDLMADEDLIIGRNSNGAPLPTNDRHKIEFNHEQGDAWTADNFALLKARYQPRISNFAAAFRGAPRVFVHYTENAGNIPRLINAVADANEDENYRLVVIDSWGAERTGVIPKPLLRYVVNPRPRPDYIWYRPDDLESQEGIDFELFAAHAVLTAISELADFTALAGV